MPRILIIDDDRDLARIMAERLENTGYRVLTVADGEGGVDGALREKPDLIVCDVGLPGMSGYEVLRSLRSHPQWRGTPFLFLTAATDERDLRWGMNLGADDYLFKPVSWADLAQAISVRLERRRQDDERANRLQQGAMDVLSGFAHDVRGPLFAMSASADLLSETGNDPMSVAEREHLIGVIHGMINRMQGMTGDLLTYSKSRLGCDPFVPGFIDPAVLLNKVRAESEAPERVAVDVPPDARPIWGDEMLLRQSLRNLVGNALKFTPLNHPPIEVGCQSTGDGSIIWVTDHGSGIAEKDLCYVFEPFWKGKSSTGRNGTGFGLAIAQSHVQRHGGTLKVVSREGQGSTFTVHLPWKPASHP